MYFERTFEFIFRTKEDFIACMDVALRSKHILNQKYYTCDGYEIQDNILILSDRSNNTKVTKLPYAFNKDQIIEFAWGWLQSKEPKGAAPNTDGSVAKGFKITTEDTGIGTDDWSSFLAIKPIWLVYPK